MAPAPVEPRGRVGVVLGGFALLADTFPLGAVVDEGSTLRGAQMHGHRWIPMLLERMAERAQPKSAGSVPSFGRRSSSRPAARRRVPAEDT